MKGQVGRKAFQLVPKAEPLEEPAELMEPQAEQMIEY
jgi:hypothetical protein